RDQTVLRLRVHQRRPLSCLEAIDVHRRIPRVFPVHAIRRGASTSRTVDVMVAGPAFQRNVVPSRNGESTAIERMSGFQLGQLSRAVRTSHTSSGAASISASAAPFTGARVLISVLIVSQVKAYAPTAALRRHGACGRTSGSGEGRRR